MKPSEGVARIDAAIANGRKAIWAAADLFQGAVPPPPWPSPELYRSIDDAKDVRDRLEVFVRHGDPDFNAKTPQVARVVAEVEKRVATIELETARLEGRRELVAQRTPTALVARVKSAAKEPKWLAIALLGYALWEQSKKPHRR